MNPALSVLEELGDRVEELLWVGSEGGMEEELVKRQNIPYQTIPAAGLHGVGWKQLPGNLSQLAKGYFSSRKILREFKPDVLFFTGGFVAAPMAMAGVALQSLLYVPDIEPGLALKYIAGFSDKIALTSDSSRKFFPWKNRLITTGYPTRFGLKRTSKAAARNCFNLNKDGSVLLVFGGSKGARSINRAITRNLKDLLAETKIIHITGKLDWDEVKAVHDSLSADQRKGYQIFSYLHEDMGKALAAADLVLSRAGASTLGEFPLFALPAILVPYPHAWRYQKVNADYLVQHGAAVMIENARLEENIVRIVSGLLKDPTKLQAMSHSMRSLAQPKAAEMIANAIIDLAAEKKAEA